MATGTQAKAAADFGLSPGERQHATVSHIADVHQGLCRHGRCRRTRLPDPGIVVPPAVQGAMDGATIRGMHAKAAVDEARANDLRHSAVERINNFTSQRHNAGAARVLWKQRARGV